MFRDAATQENHINPEESFTSYISKRVDDVVITKTIKSFPNQKTWTNGEKLPYGQETRKHTTLPERDWMLSSRRQSEEIRRRRDLITNNTKDGQSRTSQATKAGAPPSCVRPSCKMSLTSFMLALISSTKSQLSSLLCLQRTGHCQYPQQIWEKPCWDWIQVKLLGLITSLDVH